MSFTFRPAVREAVGLLIGLAGGTGSGKTFSALRMASGIAAGKPFALIDTEAGRAKHYADQFKFDHGDLTAPFSPHAYADAIAAADKAGYPVIVVDSVSHLWAGDGGVLDMQEAELNRMAGDDWKKREAIKMAAWIKPKTEHKKMVQRLLQVRAHLILCFRAEEKIEMVRGDNGKMQIIKKQTLTGLDGWVPVCEKNLPFELTASFLLLATEPGIPHPIKLQQQHRALFPLDKPITEESGKLIAQWASGAKPKETVNRETGEITTSTAAAQAGMDGSAPLNTQGSTKAHPATEGENPPPAATYINPDDAKSIAECNDRKELEDVVKALMAGAKGDKPRRQSIAALGNARDAELAAGVDDFRAGLETA